jgi:hypothetical protein
MNNSLKENKIKENIKKLGLTKTNSIGGVRRKKKIHNPIISSRLSEEEKKINKYIDAVNTNSINVNANYIDILNVYINDWFYDLTSGLKRKDFTDKKINIDYLKETEGKLLIPFFFNTGIRPTQLIKNYSYLKSTFSNKGIHYITNYIEHLGNNIHKGAYIPKEKESDNIENINIYYEKLGLESNEIPTQAELKKQFLKLSTKYHPDKHPEEVDKYTNLFQEINEAYKIILKYHYKTTQNHLYK